uniref:C2H2-type domain-containing protein n=1 Tax=Culex tarsalis TaxID=7177 RepID=A0A1Q3EYY4_CULTA
MSLCALGCYTDNKTAFFDIQMSKKAKLCTIRADRWRAALKIDASRPNQNTRVCSDHFFLKEPALLEDQDNPDWVPWLKLNPRIPDDPVQVQQRMQKYYEKWHAFDKQICCIASCPNSTGKQPISVPLFNFPALDTSSYTQRVLSERRLLTWIQVIQQANLWNRFDIHTLKICGRHFVSGQMAELTDVKNIDWIPTRELCGSVGFTDHLAHFDLHNIASFALEEPGSYTKQEEEGVSDEDTSMGQSVRKKVVAAPAVVKNPPPSQPKRQVNVGFKCILCLGNAALKPLTPVDQVALDEFFKDKLCVKSELICKKCCQHISDFHSFHVSILKIQDGAASRKIKNIIPVPGPPPPVAQIKKPETLFRALTPDTFQCALCTAVLVGKELLNKHLYAQHKVKINCKLCKTSFTPEGYAAHKLTCMPPKPAQKVQLGPAGLVKTVPPKAKIIPVAHSNSKEKYSCYICAQFFTPEEMRDHIKTHDDVTKASGVRSRVSTRVVFDESYESCKRCNRAVHKNDREKHLRQHNEERERLKELIAKQQANNIHKCVLCQASFPNTAQLQKHREIHQKHTCRECNKEFAQKYQLNNHNREFHGIELTGETRYMTECPDCNVLVSNASYKAHVAHEHDSSEIACELCGKRIFRIALKKHHESSCTDDDPLVACTVCDKMMLSTEIKQHVEVEHIAHKEQTEQSQPTVSVSSGQADAVDQLDDLIEEDLEEERLEDEFQPEDYVEFAFKDDKLT